ncbi:MAG: helix-turn-helix domain-containing protein [Candidimonas sp.]|nr:helix-turn-helix domain-containing protein [Candidimonas sp.]
MQNLLSVTQLASRLGMAKQTIYNRHFKRKDLPLAIKIGTRLLFDPVDVQEWLESKKQAPIKQMPDPAVERRPPGRPTKSEVVARRRAHQGTTH